MTSSRSRRKTALATAFGLTAAGTALWAGIGAASPAHAAGLPAPDHVVVVVFENHAYSQVIG
ncbi:acid phosphatase, partial [Streptomyces sp. NRRL S-444]